MVYMVAPQPPINSCPVIITLYDYLRIKAVWVDVVELCWVGSDVHSKPGFTSNFSIYVYVHPGIHELIRTVWNGYGSWNMKWALLATIHHHHYPAHFLSNRPFKFNNRPTAQQLFMGDKSQFGFLSDSPTNHPTNIVVVQHNHSWDGGRLTE